MAMLVYRSVVQSNINIQIRWFLSKHPIIITSANFKLFKMFGFPATKEVCPPDPYLSSLNSCCSTWHFFGLRGWDAGRQFFASMTIWSAACHANALALLWRCPELLWRESDSWWVKGGEGMVKRKDSKGEVGEFNWIEWSRKDRIDRIEWIG